MYVRYQYYVANLKKLGPRNAPRWYVNYTVGRTADGKRVQRMKLLPGVTDRAAAIQELARVERDVAAGLDPFPEKVVEEPKLVGELLATFSRSLKNRNRKDDQGKVTRYLIPRFGGYLVSELTLRVVIAWIHELAASKLSGQSQRHQVNLLSRFFSWAIENCLADSNPVKMVPASIRPHGKSSSDGPWLEDESKVAELDKALGPEVGLMFLLGNRSGMRLGEICGLRINDLDFLPECIRVGHSYDGPLKEDRKGTGKVKFVPAHADTLHRLKAQVARRKLQGAIGDDLLFVPEPRVGGRRRKSAWVGYKREYVDDAWDRARKAVGVDLTFYEATRHTFTSRNLRDGVALDEVSAALGHSSPVVTQKHYARYVRKTFSEKLTGTLN